MTQRNSKEGGRSKVKMGSYTLQNVVGKGTFGTVYKATNTQTGAVVAVKQFALSFPSFSKVSNLREIQALKRLAAHPNIIRLEEVIYDEKTGKLALAFEMMHQNLYEVIKDRKDFVDEEVVRRYMYQCLRALDHLHRNGIFHRDLKPENILVTGGTLKLADFGSCRGIYSRPPYTEYISTRWYRPPECLLTDGWYGHKMDIWGLGCVMFEVLSLVPLFPGRNELDQIARIHQVLGTPSAEVLDKFKKRSKQGNWSFPTNRPGTGIAHLIPHVSSPCVDVITRMLAYKPEDRISARQALKHHYFSDLRAADKKTAQSSSSSMSKPKKQRSVSAMAQSHPNPESSPSGARAALAAATKGSTSPVKVGKKSMGSSLPTHHKPKPKPRNRHPVGSSREAKGGSGVSGAPSRSPARVVDRRRKKAGGKGLPTVAGAALSPAQRRGTNNGPSNSFSGSSNGHHGQQKHHAHGHHGVVLSGASAVSVSSSGLPTLGARSPAAGGTHWGSSVHHNGPRATGKQSHHKPKASSKRKVGVGANTRVRPLK